MNEQQAELTSAFLDGELDGDAGTRAVSTLLGAGPEALERFGRYRLIGDVMRGESSVPAHTVAAGVRAALHDEPVVLAPRRRVPARWAKPLAGLAVAASVAAAAVVVAPQLLTQPGPAPQPQVAAVPTPQPLLVASGPAATEDVSGSRTAGTGRWQALDRTLEERLNRLVIEHNEFGGRTGINGPVPHIGFVSYDGR